MARMWDAQNASKTAYWTWVVLTCLICSATVFPTTYEVFRSLSINDIHPIIHTFDLLRTQATSSLFSQSSVTSPSTTTPRPSLPSLLLSLFTILYNRLAASMKVLEHLEAVSIYGFHTDSPSLWSLILHIFTSDLLPPVFLLITILQLALLPSYISSLSLSSVPYITSATGTLQLLKSVTLCLCGIVIVLYGDATVAFFGPATWLILVLYLLPEKRRKEK